MKTQCKDPVLLPCHLNVLFHFTIVNIISSFQSGRHWRGGCYTIGVCENWIFWVRIALLWEWVLWCLKRQGIFVVVENLTSFRPPTNSIKNCKKYKGNLKIYKGKYASEHFGSHFSHIGLINLISWPGCHIFTDVSLDTHINMTYVRHLSSLTSEICQ